MRWEDENKLDTRYSYDLDTRYSFTGPLVS